MKDPQTRKTFIRKYGTCFNCLAKDHRANSCSVVVRCKLCNAGHHTELCSESSDNDDIKPKNSPKNVQETKSEEVSSPATINLHVATGGLVALLHGCVVRCILRGERETKVRVIFDSGSHRSFVTLKAASLVSPKGLGKELLGLSMFGQKCANTE